MPWHSVTAVISCKSLLMENNYEVLRDDCNRFFTQRRRDVGPAVELWRSNYISSFVPNKWDIFKDVTLAVTHQRTSCSRQWGVLFIFTSFRAAICTAVHVLQRLCARKFWACISVAVFILCSCLVACSWVHCSHFRSVLAIVLPQPMCEFFFKAIPVLLSNVTSLGRVSPIKTSCEVHPKF